MNVFDKPWNGASTKRKYNQKQIKSPKPISFSNPKEVNESQYYHMSIKTGKGKKKSFT